MFFCFVRVENFLNQLDKVVKENNLFNDEFSLEHIAVELDAFHQLIGDDRSIEQHFVDAQGLFNLLDSRR